MKVNLRKPIIYLLLYLSGSKIPQNLKEIKRIEKFSEEEIKRYQEEKLKNLLLYAYNNVPYYKKVLKKARVIQNGEVLLENFHKIPILTKDIIREEKKNLFSKEKRKKTYENTSGGSTGEPVRFLQDGHYSDWNIANKIYYKTFTSQDIGERELRLWGSERDLLEGKESFKIRLRNWLYNRKEFNSFKMSKEDMERFVEEWNRFKPEWVEAYVQSIHEFAKFVKENKKNVYKPKGILTSAGTLYPEIKKEIEDIFKTKVFNRYGSREVGDVACSCEKNEGLHVSIYNQYLEIVKKKEDDDFGKIIVTNLNNYSMPLIRYDIGDIAVPSKKEKCSCGRGMPLIGEVKGRDVNLFKTKKGELIDGEFFTHEFYLKSWVKKFQVVQKDYELIEISVVGVKNIKEMDIIERDIKKVMGDDCKITWKFVKEIKSLKNGKYLYVISEVGG